MDLLHGISRRFIDNTTTNNNGYFDSHEEDYELLGDAAAYGNGNDGGNSIPYTNGNNHRPLRNPGRRRVGGIRGCCALIRYHLTLRRVLLSILTIFACLVVGVLWSGIPPNYEDIRAFERHLPQHNLTQARLSMAGGGKGRRAYLRFPDHLWGHGLNNVVQESLLMHYVAYTSRRSYVFEDYVWSHLPFPYTLYDFALRPSRIPLNAFISGPTAGGGQQSTDTALQYPAVSAEFWELVCPPEKRRRISSKGTPRDAQGSEIVDWWVKKLENVLDECVEVVFDGGVIFDFSFFGSDRILSLWPGLSVSPILTNFTWSPLVHSTILRNFPILQPESTQTLYEISSNVTLTGLVAIHLRRGDYRRHCPRLARWRSSYNGLNQYSGLPDKFNSDKYVYESDAYEEYYMRHCLPTVEQLVDRLAEVRKDRPGLRRVYVLTNAWGWWLNGLKSALKKDGWEDLKSTLDLELDPAQKHVAMAVDMAIAEKAQVFVGNGFSSLSSNIVMFRMAKGIDISSNRFL